MTKAEQIQGILDGWREEYGVSQPIQFMCWIELGGGTMGKCTHRRNRCEIYLDDKWENRKLGWLETSVLWHEFCHANAYLEDGVRDGHNKHFVEYRKRKPKYSWGDLVAKLIYIFL